MENKNTLKASEPMPEGIVMPESIVMPEAVVASFAQVTLHRQTAGRAGRTVTMVTVKPPRPPAVLDALAKALRRGLGCGSHVEQDRIVLQGDISDRAQDWFLKKGARKVISGN